MAVFRIERTRDYTVMSNHHLRNANLSLKAKGLLSMMLSLPEDWNYTTRGLAKICKEGVDAIGAALRELEAAGYIVRHKLRDRQGRISDTEYVIYEQPQLRKPDTDSPDTENPYMDKPDTEKPAELNIEKSNTQKQNIYGSSTDSIPFRDCAADCLPERKGRDAMSLTEIESYRELIQENIGYEYLCQQYETYREDLDEIVELIVETVCAKRKTSRIAGSDFPHEIVRSRFLKLDNSHIEFVMDCLQKNTTEIRNMKQYLLTVLFNMPYILLGLFATNTEYQIEVDGSQRSIFLKTNDVVLDKSFIEPANIRKLCGKRRFTLAHECAHQILFQLDSDDRKIACHKRPEVRGNGSRVLRTQEDWNEWQANTLGAAILMPQSEVDRAMWFINSRKPLTCYGWRFYNKDQVKIDTFCGVFGVSRSAAAIRLEQLGYLNRKKDYEYRDPLEVWP